MTIVNKKKRLLFLNPKIFYRPWPVPDDFTRYFIRIPNVTYPQLATSIRNIKNLDITVRDFLFEEISDAEYKRLIKENDIFCINVMADVVALNIEINIDIIKKINPSAIIILGGHHATFFAEEWLKRGADFIVLREGDLSFPVLIENILSNTNEFHINGILSANNLQCSDENLPYLKDLDILPMPDFNLVNYKFYNICRYNSGFTASLETSRGCVYDCSFCTIPIYWGKTQRFKSAERVCEEIDILYKIGIRQIAIVDDNFFAFPHRDYRIFEYVLSKYRDVIFGSFLRADYVIRNPEVIKIAARAGLKIVFIGYESDDIDAIERMGKRIEKNIVDKYAEIYQFLHNNDVYVYGFYLTGFPFQKKISLPSKKVADILLYSDWKPRKYTKLSKEFGVLDNFYWFRFLDERRIDPVKMLTFFFVTLDWRINNKFSRSHMINMLKGYADTIENWRFLSFIEFLKKISNVEKREELIRFIVDNNKKRIMKRLGL